MDTKEILHSSTPLQCRHDSGFEKYPENVGLSIELSPIRKPPSVYYSLIEFKAKGLFKNWIKAKLNVATKKLDFSSECEINNNDKSDSGIECDTTVSSNEDLTSLSSVQLFTDENCNLTITTNSFSNDTIYQPLKYVCRDHSCDKELKTSYCDCDSAIFSSYEILPGVTRESSKLDLLYELDIRNCSVIISNVLSHLSDEDLRQASYVSKYWQSIILKDKNACRRKNNYLNNKRNCLQGGNKENRFETATSSERNHKTAFTSVANKEKDIKQPLIFDNFVGRFDSFMQELKKNGQQTLLKCPKCRYPAKVDSGYKVCCTRKSCQHEFCEKCSGPYLDNHVCSIVDIDNSTPKLIVCSKKSRKNLRRLKA